MNQPKNRSEKYTDLFSSIDKGQIKIPQFQRDFVWSKEQTAKLIDSILKGFPLGTFILWKTKERLRHIRNVGNIKLPEPDPGDAILYVLDGQQRITSLYAVRKGIRINRDNAEIDYRDISINLELESNDEDEVVFPAPVENAACISLHKLLNAEIDELVQDYSEHIKKVSHYKSRLEGYDFSTIVIEDYMAQFAEQNSYLEKTLESHAIGDRLDFGITDDDYERFLLKRSELILSKVEHMIHPKD